MKATSQSTTELGLSFLNTEKILLNIASVKNYVKAELGFDNNLQNSWEYIRTAMHHDLYNVEHNAESPELLWYDQNSENFSQALRNLIGNVEIPSEVTYEKSERIGHEAKFNAAIDQFKTEFPETFEAFKELIAFVILAKRPGYGGGTVSNRIGLIWLAPEEKWTVNDWLENLVHEFIHNALFLDDMVQTIFTAGGSRLAEDDALAISAIRQVKRGYDKSYHSAFVSFGIITHYMKLKMHDKALKFLDPLTICVEDLVKNTNFVTSHGEQLLWELAEKVIQIRKQLEADSEEQLQTLMA
jgi:hypothetical protein